MNANENLETIEDSKQTHAEQVDETLDTEAVVAHNANDTAANTTNEGNAEDEYDEVVLEFDDSDIVCYLVDEDDNEIGFTLLDEDGSEIEYYYIDDKEDESFEPSENVSGQSSDDTNNPYDLGITKEDVANTTNDMNAIYKDGIEVAAELKGAFDDIKSALDFKSILKK